MRLLSTGSIRRTKFNLSFATAAAALSALAVQAQTPAPVADTVAYGWSYRAGGLLNLSQAYYDNWAKGGDDAFAYQWNFNGEANLKHADYTWETRSKAIYGRTKLGDLGSRKSSDQFDFETVYTRLLKILVHPFASAAAQSQFFPGFSYAGTPVERTQISDYFNPAYFTQTLGLGVEPIKNLKERVGFTMKQTVGDYGFQEEGVRTGEDFMQEYGLSSVTEYDVALMENIQASTRLDLFVNFKGGDEIDGRWANRITAKVNKWVNANFEYELLYDKDLSISAQTREGFSIGISFLTL